MPLVDRIPPVETWPELEAAAEERYWDGVSLAIGADPRTTGTVYLLGYVVEMLVKSAYYRVREIEPSDGLATELRTIPARARALGLSWEGNLHNLDSLAVLLLQERDVRGRPIDPALAGEFRTHVRSVSVNWSESLRYRALAASEGELTDVFRAVEWLRANYLLFWS